VRQIVTSLHAQAGCRDFRVANIYYEIENSIALQHEIGAGYCLIYARLGVSWSWGSTALQKSA
jgi:hypothetical protein